MSERQKLVHEAEYIADTTIGRRPLYQARCSCGWSGSLRAQVHNAKHDGLQHRGEFSPQPKDDSSGEEKR